MFRNGLRRFRKFKTNSRALRSTRFNSTALNNRVTTLNFKISRFTKMPLPDRYLCWLNIENQGSYASIAGSNTTTFGVALNDVVAPFSKSGAIGASLANPVQTITTWQPQMLKNLLFNSVTGTGIYNQFRVWTTILRVTFSPGNAADSIDAAIVPLAQGVSAYTSVEGMSAAPNSAVKTCTFGGSGESQTVEAVWSVPGLFGVPAKLYPAFSPCVGTFATTPTAAYAQISYRTVTNTPLTASLGAKVCIQYHVEFFNRTDANLLN